MPGDWFNLYLITDRRLMGGDVCTAVENALSAGVRAVALREKDMSISDLTGLGKELRELTRRYGARLFINDRLDVALAVGADGVHVGTEGIPLRAIRKVAGKRLLIGVSTHSLKEVVSAEGQGADFVTLGPVFETPSKMRYGPPIGIEAIRDAKKVLKIPLIAIGGIKHDNISALREADGIAVISGILGEDDKYAAAKRYLEQLR